jgi:PAS domain S-box-containing protein
MAAPRRPPCLQHPHLFIFPLLRAWLRLLLLLLVVKYSPAEPLEISLQAIGDARKATSPSTALTTLRGTVTAFSGWKNSFFLEDKTGAISVDRLENAPVQVGDAVEVTGRVQAGLFANIFVAERTQVLGRGQFPDAKTFTSRQLETGEYDSRFIEVEGTVRAAHLADMWGRKMLFLDVQTRDAGLTAYLLNYADTDFSTLVDSQVRIRGVCGTIFNDRRQLVGLRIFVNGLNQLRVVAKARDPSSIPISRLDSLFTLHGPPLDRRVHVRGIVTYRTNAEVYLQEDRTAIRVLGPDIGVLEPGTRAEVWGYQRNGGYLVTLEDAVLKPLGTGLPPQPLPVKSADVIKDANGFLQAPYDGLLVQLEAKVVGRLPVAGTVGLALESDGIRFQAEIANAGRQSALGLEPGTRLRLTGICIAEADDHKSLHSFHILARSPTDVIAIQTAYWNQSVLVLLVIDATVLFAGLAIYRVQRKRDCPLTARERQATVSLLAGARLWARVSVLFAIAIIVGYLAWELPASPVALTADNARFFSAAIILLAGAAVWLQQLTKNRPAQLLGYTSNWLVIAAGVLALAAGFARWKMPATALHLTSSHGIAGMFFAAGDVPLVTALSLILIGCSSLLASSARLSNVGLLLSVIVAYNSVLRLAAVVFGVVSRNGLASQLITATPFAIALFALSISILLSNPQSIIMKAFYSPRLGGLMLRRVLPAAIILPLVLGWVRLQLQINGLLDTRLGVSLFALSLALCFSALMWTSAVLINHLDGVRSSAEEAILERDRKLNLIFETGSLGDYSWEVETDAVVAHRSVWRMYGEAEKHASEPSAWFTSRQHPEDLPRIAEELRSVEAERRPFDTEFRVIWPDGSIRWISCRAVATFDASGKIAQMNGINLDITEQKRAAAKLQEGEALFRELQDAMPQIVWTADKNGVTTHYNRRWFEYTGLPSPLGWRDAVHQDDFENFFSKWMSSVATRSTYENEIRLRRASDGLYRWHLARALPICDSQGQVEHWFGTCTDIDDFKRASQQIAGLNDTLRLRVEDLIVSQHRAQEANLAKTRFLAAMSHEIRTPMNAILGMADLLWETELDSVQREYVARFRRAGSNLLTLINDILDLSKIEAGRFELEAIEFDLLELVDRVMEMASPRAILKNISVETQVVPGTPSCLIGDPVRLQQILNNLVSNAMKFTLSGRVELRIGPHEDAEPGHIRFALSDTGIGIPADKLGEIFEDFTQAESSTTRRFGGSGLGLGICRRLVEKMNGKLTVESLPGKGSTFQFDARFNVAERALKASPKELTNLAGKLVLVVDDNATNRIIICEMLASLGMKTRAASSAVEALAMLNQARHSSEPFSLILLDRVLPNTRGFETLEQIKRLDPGIPTIISSSDNQSGDYTQSRALGAVAYLMKPVRRTELLSSVVAALSSASTPPPASLAEPAEGLATLNILLAEDSEDNRFLVQAYLASKPYKLTFAANGQEAVECFLNGKFDVILMDVQMPIMDGLAATAKIRALEKEHSRKPIAIFALTANALVEDSQRSHDAGCDGHLAKPISKDRLIAAIESVRSAFVVPDNRVPTNGTGDHRYVIEIPEGFETISRKYIQKHLESIAQIRTCLEDRSMDELRKMGHNIKGTAASYGFPELTTLGAAIENAAKASDLQQMEANIKRMEHYIQYAAAQLA